MKLRTTIKGLDISAILHPKDKSTLDKLRKIPGFKSIVDKTVGSIMEKYAAIEYSAEGINVTDKSLPNIHRHVVEACRLLALHNVPVKNVREQCRQRICNYLFLGRGYFLVDGVRCRGACLLIRCILFCLFFREK